MRHAFSRGSMCKSFDRIFGPHTRASDEEMDALREARCPIGLINGSVDPVFGEHMVQRQP